MKGKNKVWKSMNRVTKAHFLTEVTEMMLVLTGHTILASQNKQMSKGLHTMLRTLQKKLTITSHFPSTQARMTSVEDIWECEAFVGTMGITPHPRFPPILSDRKAPLLPWVGIKLCCESQAQRRRVRTERPAASVYRKGKGNKTDQITVCFGNKHVVGDCWRIVAFLQGIQEGVIRKWKFQGGLKCAFSKCDNEEMHDIKAAV